MNKLKEILKEIKKEIKKIIKPIRKYLDEAEESFLEHDKKMNTPNSHHDSDVYNKYVYVNEKIEEMLEKGEATERIMISHLNGSHVDETFITPENRKEMREKPAKVVNSPEEVNRNSSSSGEFANEANANEVY